MKRNDLFWMKCALDQAKLASTKGEIPVGTVAVCSNLGLIASAHNITRHEHNPCGHAEIEVLRKAGKLLNNCRLTTVTIYVTLEPCAMCAGAMIQARIPRLVFATRDWERGAAGSVLNLFSHPVSNHHLQIDEGLLQQDAELLLNQFFQQKRTKASD
jgi:tRNA(adenine34) deaminase